MVYRLLLILIALSGLAKAQIYADFTLSYDGQPLGTFQATLEHEKVPRTVANFIGLASGQRPWIDLNTGEVKQGVPFYNGLTFHRLIHNFMIQGGSPNGNGTDNPGFSIQDEFHPDLRHEEYVLSMAKSNDPGSGGAQFFITLSSPRHLDDKHSVFGKVTSNTALLDGFKNAANFPTGEADKPTKPIVIESVVISGPSLAAFDINDPALRLPHISQTPPISVRRNRENGSVNFDFTRQFQTDYMYAVSSELKDWSLVDRHFNLNTGEYSVPANGTESSFFLRVASIDYSQVPNAPGADQFLANGNQVTFFNADNQSLTLTFNDQSGGTWVDSDERSGSFTVVNFYDGMGESGSNKAPTYFLPLNKLVCAFSSPAGPGNWNSLDALFSFHKPGSGYIDGFVNGGTPAYWRFTYQPAP